MMQIEFVKLLIIFLAILGFVLMKQGLGKAITVAVICTVVLFRIPPGTAAKLAFHSVYEKDTLLVIGSFLMVTFIQRVMENRKLLERAELALERLSGNRRLVCILAPVIIGFLPSAGAVNICGEIVNDTVGDDLTIAEKTFVTSYYRHISESFSPTYNAILLALAITGVSTGAFVLCMIPLVVVLLVLGYIFYLRKIDKNYSTGREGYNRSEELKQLLYCFWPLVACIVVVTALNIPVIQVLPVIILIAGFVYHLSGKEIIQFARSSFEKRIIVNTIILMIFKNILTYTGVIETLPSLFEGSELPDFVAFGLIMLFGTIVSGANAMIVLLVPLAFSTIPGAGTALLVFLMSVSYAAMQISPTHICLAIITEYFHESWVNLIRKTLPVIVIFLVILHAYYLLLVQIFHI